MPTHNKSHPHPHPIDVAFIGWHEGSAGQIHSWIEDDGRYKVHSFIHPYDETPDIVKIKRSCSQFSYPENGLYKNLPFICQKDWPSYLKAKNIQHVLVTSPVPNERYEQIQLAQSHSFHLINAIHPTAIRLNESIIGHNIIMHAKSFLGYRAELEDGVILNVGAQVDHHSVIRHSVTIDPGVVMAGNVTIEKKSIIHTGAIIINKIHIGEQSIIGAGSVIIKDVESQVTVVGNPSRIIKHNGKQFF